MARFRVPWLGVPFGSRGWLGNPPSGNPTLNLGATEAPDTASFAIAGRISVALGAVEAPDVAAFSIGARARISLAATEAPDTAAFAVASRVSVSLGATEAPDIAAFSVAVLSGSSTVALGATEAPDIASFLLSQNIPTQGGGAPLSNLPNFGRRRKDGEEKEQKDKPESQVLGRPDEAVEPSVSAPTPKQENAESTKESEARHALEQQVQQGDALAVRAIQSIIDNVEQRALLAAQEALLAEQENEEMKMLCAILALVE